MAKPSKPRKAQQQPRRSASGRGLLAGVVLAAVAALLGLRGRLAGVAERPSLVRTPCSRRDYKPAVPGCSPTGDACGRLVLDGFASTAELAGLRAIAARGMALGGGDGGPTILDLQSGALSWRDKFIDVWAAFNASGVLVDASVGWRSAHTAEALQLLSARQQLRGAVHTHVFTPRFGRHAALHDARRRRVRRRRAADPVASRDYLQLALALAPPLSRT